MLRLLSNSAANAESSIFESLEPYHEVPSGVDAFRRISLNEGPLFRTALRLSHSGVGAAGGSWINELGLFSFRFGGWVENLCWFDCGVGVSGSISCSKSKAYSPGIRICGPSSSGEDAA